MNQLKYVYVVTMAVRWLQRSSCCLSFFFFFQQQSLSRHGWSKCVSDYFPFFSFFFLPMQERILCWIHKLKSPCVGEELNGSAYSVNSCFGSYRSRQIWCHMTLLRSDSGDNEQPAGNILSTEEWVCNWRGSAGSVVGAVGSNPGLIGKQREDGVDVLPFSACYHITIDCGVMQWPAAPKGTHSEFLLQYVP